MKDRIRDSGGGSDIAEFAEPLLPDGLSLPSSSGIEPDMRIAHPALRMSHASCTLDIVWPVSRFPPYSSRSREDASVLMSSRVSRSFHRGSLPLISLIHT